ncbi:hypothetical protein Tco_0892715 [Tanacetum coccineum]|uniref:Uncharacterized protein n=1 Tax=Tanacetum coccineum TaxID=301880 RepID=A0ABQ5C815_9ASTR
MPILHSFKENKLEYEDEDKVEIKMMGTEMDKELKAYLLEDKQIPNVGVFDKVFSTWMAFGENSRDLGSFGEETDKITTLHQILEEVVHTEYEDGITRSASAVESAKASCPDADSECK